MKKMHIFCPIRVIDLRLKSSLDQVTSDKLIEKKNKIVKLYVHIE